MEKTIEEIINRDEYLDLSLVLDKRCEEFAEAVIIKMCVLGIHRLNVNGLYLRRLDYYSEDGRLNEDLVVFRKHYHNECLLGRDYDEDCEYRDYNVYGSLLHTEDDLLYRDSNCIVYSANNDEILDFLLNIDSIFEILDECEDSKVQTAKIAIKRTDEYFKENDNSTETETVEESK